MEIQLALQKDNTVISVPFSVDRMVNAGFTGRDQKEVRHHLDELAAKGIEVPDSTPLLYPVIPNTLTRAKDITVYDGQTAGEIEYILFVENKDRILVGIGSDHTDRKLEELDIPRAKQISPNVFSPLVWDLADVNAHWDELSMECTVQKDGEDILYQKGGLNLLMSPDELLDFVSKKIDGPLENIVIFSGTVKMETEEFVYADKFSGNLTDAALARSIAFEYTVKPMDYMV